MNIYVSNIPFKATESDLRELFEEYGDVSSVKIITDKETQRSRGFGFVEMSDDAAAKDAMTNLNGHSFIGKELSVSEARPKTENSRGGSGGGGYNNNRSNSNSNGYTKRW